MAVSGSTAVIQDLEQQIEEVLELAEIAEAGKKLPGMALSLESLRTASERSEGYTKDVGFK